MSHKITRQVEQMKEELKSMNETRSVNRIKFEMATLQAQLEGEERECELKGQMYREISDRHRLARLTLYSAGVTSECQRVGSRRVGIERKKEKKEYKRIAEAKKRAMMEEREAIEKMRSTQKRMKRVMDRARRTFARA